MRRVRTIAAVLGVLIVAIFTASVALAQDQPDATFTFTGGSVSLGVGYVWGHGVLTYQGKEYPFSVHGLSAPALGGSHVSASGTVYGLKSLEDFNGTFMAATASATAGGGAGASAMRNQRGVVIHLLSTSVGFEFQLATSGMNVALRN